MTEDIQAPTSMSEFNRSTSSEKPQLIDMIDQLANSSELLPYEITETNPGSPFIEENQENAQYLPDNSAHQISDGTKQHQGKTEEKNEEKNCLFYQESKICEEESRDGLHEKTLPLSTKEFQGEENAMSKLQNENIDRPSETDEEQRKIPFNKTGKEIKEEILLKDNGNSTEEDLNGAEEEPRKETNVNSHKKGQGNNNTQCLPISLSCTSQTEKYNEQPGAPPNNDISRHSYSRYNTISYRKIRKGNTKQRIDEFESMMHS